MTTTRGKIDYKTPTHQRWEKLEAEIATWSREDQEKVLLAAASYRSGENACGSIYMGGMAHAQLRHALGDGYPGTKTYAELISTVPGTVLKGAIRCAMHTIEYMLHNPRKAYPCCGQIVKA